MAEQQLDSTQVSGSTIDQRGLGAAQRVRAEQAGIEPNASDPPGNETCVLPCRDTAARPGPRAEQEFPRLLAGCPDVIVDRLPGLLRHLEPNRVAGLSLADSHPVHGISVRGNVLDLESDDIATAQFAVDGQVEQRQVTRATLDLELGPDRFDSRWSCAKPRTSALQYRYLTNFKVIPLSAFSCPASDTVEISFRCRRGSIVASGWHPEATLTFRIGATRPYQTHGRIGNVRPSAFAVLRFMSQPEFSWLLHQQGRGGPVALENRAGIDSDQAVGVRNVRSVAHQTPGRRNSRDS
jgi:hypothetical protein